MRLLDTLSVWLATYAKNSGKSTFVIGFRETHADALLIHLCSKITEELNTSLSVHVVTNHFSNNIFNGTVTTTNSANEEFYLKCHYIADNENGIIVGPIDKTFGLYYRSYGKFIEGAADIFPLFNLSYNTIVNISEQLYPDFHWQDSQYKMYDNILQANDIDFSIEAEDLYGIITRAEMPNLHSRWPYFIASQKQILALVHQREKLTRHKKIIKPYPNE